jgi:hypothetical protein
VGERTRQFMINPDLYKSTKKVPKSKKKKMHFDKTIKDLQNQEIFTKQYYGYND